MSNLVNNQGQHASRFSLRPPGPAARLAPAEIKKKYPVLRFQVFMGIFIGYAGYYLVRNNIPLIAAIFTEDGKFNEAQIGFIANAVLISYGLSKFFMATLSDKSNARIFMPLGLLLSGIINIGIGTIPFLTSGLTIFALVMFINGWVQGMGWPPAGKELVYWFSTSERGRITSIWNTAHNVGAAAGGAAVAWALSFTGNQWQSAFWFPGLIAIVVAIVAYCLLRDNPESEGLPPIDEYRQDPPKVEAVDSEIAELSYWEVIKRHVLTNRVIVLLAFTNVFVYILRYGVVTWTPLYLSTVRGANIKEGIVGFVVFELSGIVGTIFCGWASDKIFKGNRSLTGIAFIAATGIAVTIYWLLPASAPLWMAITLVALIGGLIYGPVMLVGLQAIDLSPRNVAGTAAGFTGLFGYVFGATLASSGIGLIVKNFGYSAMFIFLIVCAAIGVGCLCIVLKDEKKMIAHAKAVAEQEKTASAE